MPFDELLPGLRSGDANAIRALIKERGAELLAHAEILADGNRERARKLTAEAFRAAIAHLAAFPDETMDSPDKLLDRCLLEAARRDVLSEVSANEAPPAKAEEKTVPVPPWNEATLREKPPEAAPAPSAQKAPEKMKPPRRALNSTVAIVLLSLCVLAVLWLIAGILMSMGWLPALDLGYGWFNEALFPLF